MYGRRVGAIGVGETICCGNKSSPLRPFDELKLGSGTDDGIKRATCY